MRVISVTLPLERRSVAGSALNMLEADVKFPEASLCLYGRLAAFDLSPGMIVSEMDPALIDGLRLGGPA